MTFSMRMMNLTSDICLPIVGETIQKRRQTKGICALVKEHLSVEATVTCPNLKHALRQDGAIPPNKIVKKWPVPLIAKVCPDCVVSTPCLIERPLSFDVFIP